MTYFFNYQTRKFVTSKQLFDYEEIVWVAQYEIGPRTGRPMYKGDFWYDPNSCNLCKERPTKKVEKKTNETEVA